MTEAGPPSPLPFPKPKDAHVALNRRHYFSTAPPTFSTAPPTFSPPTSFLPSKGNILVKEDDCSGPPASTWSSAAVALLSSLLRLPALAPPPPRLVLLDAGMIAEVGAKREGIRGAYVWCDGWMGGQASVDVGGCTLCLPSCSHGQWSFVPLPLLFSPCINATCSCPLPSPPCLQLRPTDQRNLVDFFRALTRQEGENLGRSILTLSEQHTCKVCVGGGQGEGGREVQQGGRVWAARAQRAQQFEFGACCCVLLAQRIIMLP